MFHLLAYTKATGGAVTLADMVAAVDAEFSQRNNHYIFSEPWRLGALASFGDTVTAMQSNVPHWNYVNPFQVYPPNLSDTVPGNAQVADFRMYPPDIPVNEEIAWQVSDSASEQANLFMWILTPDWKQQLPRGSWRGLALATASITTVANTWAGLASLSFTNQLRGGVYAINGYHCYAANTLATRFVFSRRQLINGRKTRPGLLAVNAYGAVPQKEGPNWLGEVGRFHTFEPPQVEAWAIASATVTHTFYLDITYLGEDQGLLNQAA